MINRFLLSTIAVLCGCVSTTQATTPVFACNLKALTQQERTAHGKLSDQLMPAVLSIRERTDGYTLRIDNARMPVSDVAAWADLERRCCPFFNLELDLYGTDGVMELSLKGSEGVKQFIQVEFVRLRDKLPK